MRASSSIVLYFRQGNRKIKSNKRIPVPQDFLDEVRYMTQSICYDLNYWGDPNDIIQNFYLNKVLRKKLLEKYDPKKAKISTWLFKVLRNLVVGQMATDSLNRHAELFYSDKTTEGPEFDAMRFMPHAEYRVVSIEAVTDHSHNCVSVQSTGCRVDPDYMTVMQRNADTDDVDGLLFQFKNFEHMFLKSRGYRKYSFDRRKNHDVETDGGSLIDIFRLFYEGYTSHEVAEMYGVTDMTVCHLKRKLAETLRRYGFEPVCNETELAYA